MRPSARRFMPCGKPGCRCQADPPPLHGPYWQWTRVVAGKTVTRRPTEPQARLYQEWIANRRRLTRDHRRDGEALAAGRRDPAPRPGSRACSSRTQSAPARRPRSPLTGRGLVGCTS